jgi:hypothetical protein
MPEDMNYKLARQDKQVTRGRNVQAKLMQPSELQNLEKTSFCITLCCSDYLGRHALQNRLVINICEP